MAARWVNGVLVPAFKTTVRNVVAVPQKTYVYRKKKNRRLFRLTNRVVDASTNWSTASYVVGGTSSSAEQAFAQFGNHKIAGTNRAHHVSRSDIGKTVQDYCDRTIPIGTLLDRVGTLYLTSWQDVWVTPRIFWIWGQWANALSKTFRLAVGQFMNLPEPDRKILADLLIDVLERSVANIRVGHAVTDSVIGHALAPRVHRGQYDLLARLIAKLNKEDLSIPRLTFESTVVASVWNAHFVRYPRNASSKNVFVVNQIFLGPSSTGIYLSEDMPTLANRVHVIAPPRRYPLNVGTTDLGYVVRTSRAIQHLAAALLILAALYELGINVADIDYQKELDKEEGE